MRVAHGWTGPIRSGGPRAPWQRTLHRAGIAAAGANGLAASSSVNERVGGTEALSAALERTTDPDSLDEIKEQLVVLGRERGFVTSGVVFEALPEITPDQVEDVLEQLTDHLTTEGIENIELPGDDTDAVTQIRVGGHRRKAPTSGPVRMYLKG